jgi:hypothetical protein
MTTYKKAAQYLSILCMFATVQAHADDAICNNATAVVHKLNDKALVYNTMAGVSPTYQATIAEGFLYGDQSGMVFKDNKSVPWGAGDLLVIHAQESDEQVAKGQKNPIKFFIQFDEAPYNGPNDKGTKGGIYKVQANDMNSNKPGVTCSKEGAAYAKHFFPKADAAGPIAGDMYCVRTRSGENYALIKVVNVCSSGVVFNYKFNGKSNEFNNEQELAPGQKMSIQQISKSVSRMLGQK